MNLDNILNKLFLILDIFPIAFEDKILSHKSKTIFNTLLTCFFILTLFLFVEFLWILLILEPMLSLL